MDHLILGYATHHGLGIMTEEDARTLTHVNLAFATLKDGMLDMAGLPDLDQHLSRIRGWNPALRFVLSVGGWGAGGFSHMARTDSGRRKFASSVTAVLSQYGLDGVDIDWEYPCSPLAGIDYSPQDRENFTLLLQALREAMGEGKILSIAAGGGRYFIRDTEMKQVSLLCDYVQLMTYDLRSGFCTQSGHHTSLYAGEGDGSELNVDAVVRMFEEAGVPRNRMVIGAAFYSRRWTGVPDVHQGLLQPAGSVGEMGGDYDVLVRSIMDQQGFIRYWDDQAKAPYLFNGNTFLSYDDPRSIACKCVYVKAQGLLGIMYWEHGCDSTHTLLQTIGRELKS